MARKDAELDDTEKAVLEAVDAADKAGNKQKANRLVRGLEMRQERQAARKQAKRQ